MRTNETEVERKEWFEGELVENRSELMVNDNLSLADLVVLFEGADSHESRERNRNGGGDV